MFGDRYDRIYTDSPYLVERCNTAIYLDTLLDQKFDSKINDIRKIGHEVNKQIINIFFQKYNNRNINILDIDQDFTNIYINIEKLIRLIDKYPNDEISIGITTDELYNYKNSNSLDKYVNVYYWVASISKIKNINLIKIDYKRNDLNEDHQPINSWFLRLIDLDKKVIIYNLLKKLNLINKNKKKKIYIYKRSPVVREIETYLYASGFSLIDLPEIEFKLDLNKKNLNNEKISFLLDKFFNDDPINKAFKNTLFEVYKKRILYYSQKETYTSNYILKLDKSSNIIITNTINNFDSYIFAKQLQESGFKIVNIIHGLTTSYKRKQDFFNFFEWQAPDMTLCFNTSERDLYNEILPKENIYPISVVQEAKKKRFRFFKRIYVNKLLNIKDDINVFYPSINYPYNNRTIYGFRRPDKFIYEFEKKMILLSSNINKRMIYKNYPKRCFIDSNPLTKFAKNLKNIKVIDTSFDFRYVSCIGDIFILVRLGSSSTMTWMLGEDKPIIYLYSNKFQFINDKSKNILDKIFIVINIDEKDWYEKLIKILNKPYNHLVRIWKNKKIYRDKFDEKWLMGNNLHAGKLGTKYIDQIYNETNKNKIK